MMHRLVAIRDYVAQVLLRRAKFAIVGAIAFIVLISSFTAHGQTHGRNPDLTPGGPGSGPTPTPSPSPDTWTVTYSSSPNSITVDGDEGLWYADYSGAAPYTYGGGEGSGDPPTPFGAQELTPGWVNCSGTITATITWNGPDPVPPAIELDEYSNAWWGGAWGWCMGGLPSSVEGASTTGAPVVTDLPYFADNGGSDLQYGVGVLP